VEGGVGGGVEKEEGDQAEGAQPTERMEEGQMRKITTDILSTNSHKHHSSTYLFHFQTTLNLPKTHHLRLFGSPRSPPIRSSLTPSRRGFRRPMVRTTWMRLCPR
jgi:hypothetical protein